MSKFIIKEALRNKVNKILFPDNINDIIKEVLQIWGYGKYYPHFRNNLELLPIVANLTNWSAKTINYDYYEYKFILLQFLVEHHSHVWSDTVEEIVYIETPYGQVSFHSEPEIVLGAKQNGINATDRKWSGSELQHNNAAVNLIEKVIDDLEEIKSNPKKPIKENKETTSKLNLSWWYSRFNREYKNEEEARKDIAYVVNKSNNDPVHKMLGSKDITVEEIVSLFRFKKTPKGIKVIPVHKLKTNKPTIVDNWDNFELITTSNELLHQIGNSNFTDYEIKKPVLVNIYDYIDKDAILDGYENHKNRIENLGNQILESKKFEPIVVEPNEMWVIEGQHRIRALALKGFKKIMAYQILNLDEQDQLNENIEQVFVYHGTSKGVVLRIQRSGYIEPHDTGEDQPTISFTGKLNYAKYYAKMKGGDSKAIILRTLLTPELKLSNRIKNNSGYEYITPNPIPIEKLEILAPSGKWYPLKDWDIITGEQKF